MYWTKKQDVGKILDSDKKTSHKATSDYRLVPASCILLLSRPVILCARTFKDICRKAIYMYRYMVMSR